MRLVIDMQGAQTPESHARGTGRYTRDLVAAVLRQAGAHEIHLCFANEFKDTFLKLRKEYQKQIPVCNMFAWQGIPSGQNRWDVQSRLHMNAVFREDTIRRNNPDYIFVSSMFEGATDVCTVPSKMHPTIPYGTTLYDLSPLYPELKLLEEPEVKKWYLEKLEIFQKSRLLLAISESARQDAIELLRYPPDRVTNISAGINHRVFHPAPSGTDFLTLKSQLGLTGRFVFYFGGFNPHKNLVRLVEAMASLVRNLGEPVKLVVAGSISLKEKSALLDVAMTRGFGANNIIFTGFIDDDVLVSYLWVCDVFIYPSLREGFGLPVAEAMACGAPVICGNNSSLPEVVGRADAVFDSRDPLDIAQALYKVLSNSDFAEKLRESGIERAKKFNWDSCGRALISAYEAVAEIESLKGKLNYPSLDLMQRRMVLAAGEIVPNRAGPMELQVIADTFLSNRPEPGPGRLLVDVTSMVLSPGNTGIPRVTREVTLCLLEEQNGREVVPIYCSADGSGFRSALGRAAHFFNRSRQPDGDELIRPRTGDHFLALDLNYNLNSQEPFFRKIRAFGGELSAVVFDLLPLLRPDWFPKEVVAGHVNWFETVAHFDRLACISDSVLNDVKAELDLLGLPRSQIFGRFHLGSQIPVGRHLVLPEILQGHDYIAIVSTIYARKGQLQALEAFERLWALGEDTFLVIVGRRGVGAEDLIRRLITHPERGNRLFWFDAADDDLLHAIYQSSLGVLVSSEGEGFGLPLVEATYYKRPVLARDIPVFREIIKNGITWFDGLKSRDLANSLAAWIGKLKVGTAPVASTDHLLSWSASTAQLLRILDKKLSDESADVDCVDIDAGVVECHLAKGH